MSILKRIAQGGAESGQTLILPLILSVLCLVALGLMLVWMNIERTQMAYQMLSMKDEVTRLSDLSAKLTVEKAHLLSQLGDRAKDMGLQPANPGQTRRMDPLPATPPQAEDAGADKASRN